MNRKQFLATIGAIIAAPFISKTETPKTEIHNENEPTKWQFVGYSYTDGVYDITNKKYACNADHKISWKAIKSIHNRQAKKNRLRV